MLHAGAGRVVVMVVVPALAHRHEPHEPVVAAVFAGLVVAVAEEVGERVDAPGDVPDHHRADEDAPHQPAGGQLPGRGPVAAGEPADREPGRREARGVGDVDSQDRHRVPLQPAVVVVGEDVAGILFEVGVGAAVGGAAKQPAGMRPADAIAGGVGILLVVGVDMVEAMVGHPAGGRVLERAEGDGGERPLQAAGHLEAPMGQEPVVAEVDAEGAEDHRAREGEREPRPAEAPGNEGQAGQQMDGQNRDEVFPMNTRAGNGSDADGLGHGFLSRQTGGAIPARSAPVRRADDTRSSLAGRPAATPARSATQLGTSVPCRLLRS